MALLKLPMFRLVPLLLCLLFEEPLLLRLRLPLALWTVARWMWVDVMHCLGRRKRGTWRVSGAWRRLLFHPLLRQLLR